MDDDTRLDRRILAAVSLRGRRLLTTDELKELGASKRQIRVRVCRGTLQRVHKGVYLVGAGELTWREEILAGVLAGGETAKADGFSALRLYGLEALAPGRITVTIQHGTEARAKGVTFRRTRRILPVTVKDGVRCVSVEQALLDVARDVPPRVLHRLLTSAWRMRLTTPRKVLIYLETYGGSGVTGTRKLREVAAIYDDHSRGPGSEAEADFIFDFYAELDAQGIERPKLQYVIEVYDGTEKVVPDFAWPERRKAIEVKGLSAHGDYVRQDDDNEREAAIRAAGWDLEIVTPRSMRERRAKTIARLIRFLQS